MREIKFRGRRGYDGKWLYGNLIIDFANRKYIVPFEYFGLDGHHLVYEDHTDEPVFIDEETIGEYTGLKDKRNTEKDLYENDLVKVLYHYSGDNKVDEFVGRIEWSDDCWLVVDVAYKDNAVSLWDYVYNYCGGLIGNIHENPDLIKRENK